MKRLAVLGCTSLLVAGCSGAGDEDFEEKLADSIRRVADAIIEEIRGTGTSGIGALEDGLTVSPATPVYASDSTDTLETLLPFGAEAFAPFSSAVHRDSDNLATAQPDEGVAFVSSIRGDNANGFHVTFVVEGTSSEVHFAASDFNYTNNLYNTDGGSSDYDFSLITATDSFRDPTDRTSGPSYYDYVEMMDWWAGTADGLYQGWLAFGAQTPSDSMPEGSASYDGEMSATVWQEDDHTTPTGRTYFTGDLDLDANFDSSSISGRISNLGHGTSESWVTLPDDGLMPEGNTITVYDGAIEDNQFTADWRGNDTDTSSVPENSIRDFAGTMVGAFYGPGGEEVAGVMGGHRAATSSTPVQYLDGAFVGSQPIVVE